MTIYIIVKRFAIILYYLISSIFMTGYSIHAQTSYYIGPTGDDNNPGNNSLPWATITYGVNQLSPGDVLIIKTGTYAEKVVINGNITGGSAAGHITIRGEANAIIDGQGLSPNGSEGLITIVDAQYIIIDNLELKNFVTSTGYNITDSPLGIYIHGNSHDLIVRNIKIHDIRNLSSCNQTDFNCGPSANGIGVFGDTQAGIYDIEFLDNEIYNCTLASSEAFVLNGNIDRFTIKGNHVHDNNNIGFDFIGYEGTCSTCINEEDDRVRNGIVSHNKAINNTTTLGNPWYGNDGESAGGFYVDGGRNIIFNGNESTGNDIGFEFASEQPGKSTEDILMINNVIYKNLSAGLSIGGYGADPAGEGGGSAERIYVYNNSFYQNWDWGTEINFAYRIIDASFQNNIIYGVSAVNDNFYQEPNGQHQNIIWGKNIWWGSSTNGQASLPGQALVIDPLYSNSITNNFALQSNSSGIDVGIAQADITDWTSPFWGGNIRAHGTVDQSMNLRYNGIIDMGAYEYDSISLCTDDFAEVNMNGLSGTINNTMTYKTDGIIDSRQVITNSALINYDSKIEINLLPGFEVVSSATLHAFIDGCGGI